VVVDNVAEGASPRIHLVKLAPKESFTVHEEGGRLLIAEEGYRRYDTAASLFASLDPELTARLYETLKPLIQQAYRDLGYPRADFDATLERAIRRLLETPIVHGDVEVERGVRSYRYVDPRLEELSPAQKQLLRMGPANVRKVQEQLRALATPLGIPATRLAQTPVIQER
jgi:hypothetical protein